MKATFEISVQNVKFIIYNYLMFIIFKNRMDNDNILEKDDEDDNDDENSDELENEEFIPESDESIDPDINNDDE